VGSSIIMSSADAGWEIEQDDVLGDHKIR